MNTNRLLRKLYVTVSLFILVMMGLAGCGVIEFAATETGSSEAGGSAASGIEVGIEPTPTPGLRAYSNETYGFKFTYPETWALSEQDHGVILMKGTNRLEINFRWADEQIDQFGRTGMGAGDFIYAGKVNFMNQVIPAEALFFQKKTKAVFYGESGLVETGDLVFVIALEDLETDYTEVDLSEEIIAEAGTILESFRRPGLATGAGTSAETSGLEAYLKVQSPIQQGGGEPISVNFRLENHTQEGLYLLKWYTPLEGIGGDIFEVTRDGQPIAYMGPMASRSAPTPESYIFVEPEKGVTTEVNIAEAYDFSQLGTYSIQFRSPRISHLARSEAEMATSLGELGPVNIPSNVVTLEVVASSAGVGQPVRRTAEQAGEMISAHLLKQKPGLMEVPALAFEEVPDERVWEELQGQVFRVTEGIFKNESFLLRRDSIIQIGEAIGGQGLLSMGVSDLDQDGQAELLFTYGAGLSPGFGTGTQTRVGMYEPVHEGEKVMEANMAYLGTAALVVEGESIARLHAAVMDETTGELRYLDSLGQLSIENSDLGGSLIFQVDPNLPGDLRQNIVRSE
jgi:hypothetical protein